MAMSEQNELKILTSVENGIGRLTLNNSDKLNAISVGMWDEIHAAVQRFEADPSVRAVVIRGAGERAFSTGADISEFADRLEDEAFHADYDERLERAVSALNAFPKPLIGAISGYCIGGGFYLALACDVRFVTRNAIFAITGAKLGLGYSHTIISGMVDLIGPARSSDILFTSRNITGEEAQVMGLANFLVENTALEETVWDYATTIAKNAPLAVQACKFAVAECAKDRAARELGAIDRKIHECMISEDASEGIRSHVERRAPVFKGR